MHTVEEHQVNITHLIDQSAVQKKSYNASDILHEVIHGGRSGILPFVMLGPV